MSDYRNFRDVGSYGALLLGARHYGAEDHTNPVKTVDFTYNKLGRLVSYDDGTTSALYGYDDVYRKRSESVNYGSFSLGYAYDYYNNGRRKSFTGADGVTYQYTYDDANQLASVVIPNQGSITFSSYLWNRPTSVVLPGGSRREYTYDPLMRLKAITVKDPLQHAIMGYTYTYDKVDNITGKATEHGPYAYGYDELYRLKTVDNPTIPDEAFTYDPVGNRLTSAGVTGSWGYNQNNELLTYDAVTYEYDANGNATKKIAGSDMYSYTYDVGNRLVRVEDGGGTVIATYYHDPFGRRLWKEGGGTRTCFLYADEGLIGEYDAAGAEIKTYGYKPGSTWTTDPLIMKQAGQYFFYQNDHLETPQQMTNVNGGVIWLAKYESFGKALVETGSTVENNLRFQGPYFDAETGLHYNWHRYYDPETGRYLTPDPIGLAGGINLYAYARNDPVNLVDPLGLYVGLDDAIFAGGGLLVGLAGQALGDLLSGQLSGWEDYTAAAIGGAVGGEALLYTGPIGAGLAGGATTNIVKQGLKNLTGKQCGFDPYSFATDAAVGAATGLIPGLRIPGITAGRGSYNQVYKQIVTKAANGTISRVSSRTAAKMFAGRAVDTSLLPGAGAAAAAAASGLLPSSEENCRCK